MSKNNAAYAVLAKKLQKMEVEHKLLSIALADVLKQRESLDDAFDRASHVLKEIHG